ncbi:tail fiber domain-containing protein [Cronobacter turicensis]
MTVSTEISHVEYSGNGVTTAFDYPFKIFKKSDLVVTTSDPNGTLQQLVLDTDYSVSGAGEDDGGKVALVTPLANNWRISIERVLPVVQETDLRNQGSFFPEIHEDEFDYLTMLIQRGYSLVGLCLRRPSWAANFYDAQNYFISNLHDPVKPQDAATKNYTDQQINQNIDRTLRVPDPYIAPLPPIAQLEGEIIGIVNGKPVGVPVPSGTAADVLMMLMSDEPGKGDELLCVKQPFDGSVDETQHNYNARRIDPLSAGAAGDGATLDDSAFQKLESQLIYSEIDLLGKTYLVTAPPENHLYFNGYFKRASDGYIFDSRPVRQINIGNHNVLIGKNAGASMPKYVEYRGSQNAYNVFAIGHEALFKNIRGRNCTAIGVGALHELQDGRYNVAIGLEAQYYCNSDDGANMRGTRNTSVGDNTLRFNVIGRSNIAMGRNAGQSVTDVNFNTALGSASLSGYAPLGLDGETIENQTPITAGSQTFVGTNAGIYSNAVGNVGVGNSAGENIKTGQIVAVGVEAGRNIEIDRHYDGRQKILVSLSGTYSWTGGVISVTVNNHGLSVGYLVKITIGNNEANYLAVASVGNVNTFTINTVYIKDSTVSGAVAISEVVTLTNLDPVAGVIAIGRRAMAEANNCTESVAIGDVSQFASTGTFNTSVGGLSLYSNTTGQQNTALGYSALRYNTTGLLNTAIGEFSAAENKTGQRITAVGRNALRYDLTGNPMEAFDNVSGLGTDTRVSGSNQVQLGDSTTTVYAFGSVQDRSDARDKTDIRDTVLGIDFILGLRPVDGRWDMRDDYIEEYQVQTGVDQNQLPIYETRYRQLPKDGSKKRERFHHWFIAQEVNALCEKLGVDFGGYQDHKVNNGNDVLTLGYSEFIPPVVRAVQQCWQRLDELEKRLSILEKG